MPLQPLQFFHSCCCLLQ